MNSQEMFSIYLMFVFCVLNAVCEPQEECRYFTCGECISNVNCVWCRQDAVATPDLVRCVPVASLSTVKNWCAKEFIINPQPTKEVTIDKTFDETIDNVKVQFRPQHINITTRPGAIIPISMAYKPAEDFPLDVYYLMDISYTMQAAKQDLQKQAFEIYEQLTDYTNNVKLGIGSFVEKPGFPYADVYKKHEKHMSHAFKNHLSLTKNMSEFTSTIEKIRFGANYDDPEAGLDALMQAMTCEKELGWRKGSRRIIVLCTDSTYHSAGDGKVLGAFKPNDMQCHLDNNLYNDTMALTYDYPSVSQINKVATEGHFIIIFAAKKVVATEYTQLANQISGAKYAILENGKDAVNIIKKAYMDAVTTVTILYDLPPFIQLTIEPNCYSKSTRNCESTPEQRTVNIQGNLTVKYCPPDGELEREVAIKAVGINDKLTVKLKINCQCDCEKTENAPISPACNYAGYTQCGICKCNPGSYGIDCRCNGMSTDVNDMKKCKLNEDDSKLCSGRGTCRCGRCEICNKGFSGDFCQYDDNSCPHMCSNNGRCRLGNCECDSQWTGVDCSCTLENTACIAPYSKEFCSGNGVCNCGKCKCNKLDGKNETYSGSYCDDCDDCTEKRCKELEMYVVCNVMSEKPLCDKQYNATNTIVEFKNKTELNGPEWHIAKWCKTQLENDSIIIFKYQYEDENIKLGIQDEAELPPKANIFIAVGSAIGTVLLVGLLTLIIWKILVDIHDKREYQKFSTESQAAGFDVSLNPLYTPPAVNFSNPAYQCN